MNPDMQSNEDVFVRFEYSLLGPMGMTLELLHQGTPVKAVRVRNVGWFITDVSTER